MKIKSPLVLYFAMPITSLQTICIGDGVSFKCTETNENVSFLALNIHLSDDMIQINAVTCSLYAVYMLAVNLP